MPVIVVALLTGLSASLLVGLSAALLLSPSTAGGESTGAVGARRTVVVETVERVGPAVVNVQTEIQEGRRVNPFYSLDPFFEQYFDNFFERRRQPNYTRQSLGSGVIIDPKGYVLTNEHVVLQASSILLTLSTEETYSAELIGSDPTSDLAVLKIDVDRPLPTIDMGDSDDIMIGETVIAIGNPFGLSHTVTTGVVSAVGRSVEVKGRVYRDFIQTDASINPGNSGGPILNITGELIGINTAIYGEAQGIGFAIPINRAKRIVDDLIRYGEVRPVWYGLRVKSLEPQIAHFFDNPPGHGVVVVEVTEKGPADKAGVRVGDIIVSLAGAGIDDRKGFYDVLRGFTAGDPVPIEVRRGVVKHDVIVEGREIPAEILIQFAWEEIGIEVEETSGSTRRRRTPPGLPVVRVRTGSPAGRIGIKPGDVIGRIGKTNVRTLEAFRAAIAQEWYKESVLLLVYRGSTGYYVPVPLP